MPKKEIKPEQKDTKPKEPEAGVDRKEKKPATKMHVPYLILLGFYYCIDWISVASTVLQYPRRRQLFWRLLNRRGVNLIFSHHGGTHQRSRLRRRQNLILYVLRRLLVFVLGY